MDAAILQFFETIRNPFLTAVFGVFSLLGEAAVITALVLLLYWLFPSKTGELALVTALSGFCLNSFLKFTVHRPRPYVSGTVKKLDPFLGGELDGSASFPSGHTQITTGFFGTLAVHFKRALAFALCSGTVLLVALSRIYFGVHYPSDVLAGLLFGLFAVLLWTLVFRYAYSFREFILLGLAALSLIPLCFSPSQDYLQAAGLLSGAAVSLAVLTFCSEGKPAEFPRRLLRVPVGGALLVLVFAIFLLFPENPAFLFLKWFFLALAAILCAKLTFEKLQI